ncbi:uncharacterized mitochondrial protein AtMg00810-like [Juglans regia]|uniref:Uncharacterized mitochondrial protein AtMg00810-like n=1 Tax=Juglans regia TaxID=51240 RepID=A0A6P9EGB7_JUGRE|nr:uncharacterized mitochondrial protein AtMg00810-like [Juglans regia]
MINLLLYVDDIIITVVPTTDGLFISQLKYALDILTRAQLLDSKPVHTPMVVSQHLPIDGPLFSNPTLYRSLVGALPQFLHAPTEDHFLAVKCILRYVKGKLHFGLTFHPSVAPGALVAYSDADWAGCPHTCRTSTSGYSIYLGDNLVSWSVKKEPIVSHSNCESEYRALAFTAAKLLWLMHLLHDLKVSYSHQPLLLCDNKSAIFLSSNPVSHKQAKNVELDYHFFREFVLTGKLCTQGSKKKRKKMRSWEEASLELAVVGSGGFPSRDRSVGGLIRDQEELELAA